MGGRHTRNRPKIAATIPNFPYPTNILEYLFSQSSGYIITFSTPDGKTGTVDPTATTTSTPAATTPIATTPAPTTPAPFEKAPAYSTTFAPTSPPPIVATTTPAPTTKPVPPELPPQIPKFWYAAIKAMEFLNELGPVDDEDKLKRLYDNLISEIERIKGDEMDSVNNTAALIYFSTVVSMAFAPFNESFTYNHLNGKFPKVFKNSKIYRKICMLNYYSIHLSKVFKKLKNRYIATNDKVMKYMVPQGLNAVLELLRENIEQ